MKKFVELKFTCPDCDTLNTLDVVGVPKLIRYNHECSCGTKFFVNRLKCRVMKIGT